MRYPLNTAIAPVNPLDEIFAWQHGFMVRWLARRTRRFYSVLRKGSPSKNVFDHINQGKAVSTLPACVALIVARDFRDVIGIVVVRNGHMGIMSKALARKTTEEQLMVRDAVVLKSVHCRFRQHGRIGCCGLRLVWGSLVGLKDHGLAC